jgi:hypothetical protein
MTGRPGESRARSGTGADAASAVAQDESASRGCTCPVHDVRNSTTMTSEIVDGVRVWRPALAPVPTYAASRALLAILIELTEVPVLDGPAERGTE